MPAGGGSADGSGRRCSVADKCDHESAGDLSSGAVERSQGSAGHHRRAAAVSQHRPVLLVGGVHDPAEERHRVRVQRRGRQARDQEAQGGEHEAAPGRHQQPDSGGDTRFRDEVSWSLSVLLLVFSFGLLRDISWAFILKNYRGCGTPTYTSCNDLKFSHTSCHFSKYFRFVFLVTLAGPFFYKIDFGCGVCTTPTRSSCND